jgi:dGTPase
MDHVLFVASAARTVARCLELNEDLAEAIGLAHDIGHAPFGHQGEDFLNEIINKKENAALREIIPNFHHEVYGLRVVDKIAKCDRESAGLNLTWEVRDGIISHCGEDFKTCRLVPGSRDKTLETITSKHQAGFPATMEGCIVRLIDKVAYCGKDIEDAIASQIIRKDDVPQCISDELGKTNGQIVGTFVENMIEQSHNKDYIAVSERYGDLMHKLINFNKSHIYDSEKAKGYRKQAEQTVLLLFDDLLRTLRQTKRFTDCLTDSVVPTVYKVFEEFVREDMRDGYTAPEPDELIVLDFIAGMTDSFLVRSFQELFIPQSVV